MKKYEMPDVEIVVFAVEDIVTTSDWQEGGAGPDD